MIPFIKAVGLFEEAMKFTSIQFLEIPQALVRWGRSCLREIVEKPKDSDYVRNHAAAIFVVDLFASNNDNRNRRIDLYFFLVALAEHIFADSIAEVVESGVLAEVLQYPNPDEHFRMFRLSAMQNEERQKKRDNEDELDLQFGEIWGKTVCSLVVKHAAELAGGKNELDIRTFSVSKYVEFDDSIQNRYRHTVLIFGNVPEQYAKFKPYCDLLTIKTWDEIIPKVENVFTCSKEEYERRYQDLADELRANPI